MKSIEKFRLGLCLGMGYGVFILFLMWWNCAYKPSLPEVALYAFEYQGEHYRIRSVYSPEGESFNELIGPGFLARDVDQNGTLDQVMLGNFSLSEAQKIYAHALDELRKQNRVKQIESAERIYRYQNSKFLYEIRTEVSLDGSTANIFKVFEMGQIIPPELAMAMDSTSDGKLDKIIKGDISLAELQAMYEKCLSKGIEEKKLIKESGHVIVKR